MPRKVERQGKHGAVRTGLALLLLAASLAVGGWSRPAQAHPWGPPRLESLVQPFIITFNRHDDHVIAFINHPEYEAVEAMVTQRPARPPLIRAILNQRGGAQIDHINDFELAFARAAILTGRETVYRPIQYEKSEVGGVPTIRLQFTSYRGEDILVHFQAASAPSPELSGFIDPGSHAGGASLPLMWANASAFTSPATVVTINGVSAPLAPGPVPGTLLAFYTQDFLIGALRAGHLELYRIASPWHLAVGERWLYWDRLGNLHEYTILALAGDQLTVRKTTTSPALTEEILQVQVVGRRLELRSVRATGRRGGHGPLPPAPAGLNLELGVDGSFSLSLDEHARLVTGLASRQEAGATTMWLLQPTEPEWARGRSVRATLSRRRYGYSLDNTFSPH